MKWKLPLIIISLIVIIGIVIFLYAPIGNDFTDIGTSFENNDNWINHNINVINKKSPANILLCTCAGFLYIDKK